MFPTSSPGACAVCGKAHAACTPGDTSAPILIAQTPARDASASTAPLAPSPVTFTTETYRGKKK